MNTHILLAISFLVLGSSSTNAQPLSVGDKAGLVDTLCVTGNFHLALADELLARKLFSASSTAMPHLQMVKPLSCKYDPFTFLRITNRILAKENTLA